MWRTINWDFVNLFMYACMNEIYVIMDCEVLEIYPL